MCLILFELHNLICEFLTTTLEFCVQKQRFLLTTTRLFKTITFRFQSNSILHLQAKSCLLSLFFNFFTSNLTDILTKKTENLVYFFYATYPLKEIILYPFLVACYFPMPQKVVSQLRFPPAIFNATSKLTKYTFLSDTT